MLETQTTPARAERASDGRRQLLRWLFEWRIVGLTILGLLAVTALPYIYAYRTTPPGMHYLGLMLGVPDHLQYFSWMRDLSHQGLASNRLTPEPNSPAFFNLLWWAVGRFGALTGLGLGALYTLLRICAVALLLTCGYAFFTVAVPDARQRRLAFLVFALTGGMGIVWVVAKYALRLADVPFPDDLYTAEANTFFVALAFPHFTLATALLTATFAGAVQALRTRQLRWAAAGGVAALLLGLQHTYDLITVYLVLGGVGALLWARDRRFPTFFFLCGLIIAGMSGPPALYMFLLVKLNPIWGAVLSQFDNAGVFTPSLPHLLILLGIPFWLALAAFRPRMLQSRDDAELVVAAWFVAHFGLAYIPTNFQIHMLLGWQVPMAVLASAALLRLVGPWAARRVRVPAALAVALVVAAAMATNVYLVGWRTLDLGRHQAPYYLTGDQVAALDWLGASTTQDDVVLADLSFGQYVPMWSDARAYVAHWANTLDFYGKRDQAAAIVAGRMPAAERDSIVAKYRVTYLVYEGDGPAPWAGDPAYPLAFERGRVSIYRALPR